MSWEDEISWEYDNQDEPTREGNPVCPECCEEIGQGDTVYAFRHSGTVVGCNHCIDKHYTEADEHYSCQCHYDRFEKVYLIKGTDVVVGCDDCIAEQDYTYL